MTNATKFEKLFEPARIGKMRLKNRIVMPPMMTGYGAEGGYVSQRLIDYHEARARGGVGLIIIEVVAPHQQCQAGNSQLMIGDDDHLPSFRELVDAVHKHDARIALQLQHSGWEIRAGKRVQVAPSAIVVPPRLVGVYGETPHELTAGEIGEMVQWFGAAARRAREAGFDGVEVHGAHQYLIASFLSSSTNQRQDRYGGTVENKARFLIEVLQAIREAAGPDYPVWPRLNGQEYGVENGVTIEETRQVARMAAGAGARAIHVSAYAAGSDVTKAPIADTPGFLVPLAKEVKRVTSLPVITVGRLDPEIGERVLKEGRADLIAIGRGLMADPEIPNKVAGGRLDEIRPCIGCMDCIERPRADGQGTACAINAAMGREREYLIQPAGKVKKVVVVGGGPAGLEAARVAALRGHQVLLLEKEPRPGGLLNVAALPPHKGDIVPWVKYLVSQAEKAGVEIRLNTEVTPELVMQNQPDAVVVATGGVPATPEIPGADGPNVVTAQDALSGKAAVGQNVVIIGGGMVGCETGDYLAEKGKNVVIIEVLKRMAADMAPMARRRLIDGLRRKQVVLLTDATCEEITEGSVIVTTGEGKKETVQADTVILAVGYRANDDLFRAVKGKVPEVCCVGDCVQPQRIREAVNDGYQAGLSL